MQGATGPEKASSGWNIWGRLKDAVNYAGEGVTTGVAQLATKALLVEDAKEAEELHKKRFNKHFEGGAGSPFLALVKKIATKAPAAMPTEGEGYAVAALKGVDPKKLEATTEQILLDVLEHLYVNWEKETEGAEDLKFEEFTSSFLGYILDSFDLQSEKLSKVFVEAVQQVDLKNELFQADRKNVSDIHKNLYPHPKFGEWLNSQKTLKLKTYEMTTPEFRKDLRKCLSEGKSVKAFLYVRGFDATKLSLSEQELRECVEILVEHDLEQALTIEILTPKVNEIMQENVSNMIESLIKDRALIGEKSKGLGVITNYFLQEKGLAEKKLSSILTKLYLSMFLPSLKANDLRLLTDEQKETNKKVGDRVVQIAWKFGAEFSKERSFLADYDTVIQIMEDLGMRSLVNKELRGELKKELGAYFRGEIKGNLFDQKSLAPFVKDLSPNEKTRLKNFLQTLEGKRSAKMNLVCSLAGVNKLPFAWKDYKEGKISDEEVLVKLKQAGVDHPEIKSVKRFLDLMSSPLSPKEWEEFRPLEAGVKEFLHTDKKKGLAQETQYFASFFTQMFFARFTVRHLYDHSLADPTVKMSDSIVDLGVDLTASVTDMKKDKSLAEAATENFFKMAGEDLSGLNRFLQKKGDDLSDADVEGRLDLMADHLVDYLGYGSVEELPLPSMAKKKVVKMKDKQIRKLAPKVKGAMPMFAVAYEEHQEMLHTVDALKGRLSAYGDGAQAVQFVENTTDDFFVAAPDILGDVVQKTVFRKLEDKGIYLSDKERAAVVKELKNPKVWAEIEKNLKPHIKVMALRQTLALYRSQLENVEGKKLDPSEVKLLPALMERFAPNLLNGVHRVFIENFQELSRIADEVEKGVTKEEKEKYLGEVKEITKPIMDELIPLMGISDEKFTPMRTYMEDELNRLLFTQFCKRKGDLAPLAYVATVSSDNLKGRLDQKKEGTGDALEKKMDEVLEAGLDSFLKFQMKKELSEEEGVKGQQLPKLLKHVRNVSEKYHLNLPMQDIENQIKNLMGSFEEKGVEHPLVRTTLDKVEPVLFYVVGNAVEQLASVSGEGEEASLTLSTFLKNDFPKVMTKIATFSATHFKDLQAYGKMNQAFKEYISLKKKARFVELSYEEQLQMRKLEKRIPKEYLEAVADSTKGIAHPRKRRKAEIEELESIQKGIFAEFSKKPFITEIVTTMGLDKAHLMAAGRTEEEAAIVEMKMREVVGNAMLQCVDKLEDHYPLVEALVRASNTEGSEKINGLLKKVMGSSYVTGNLNDMVDLFDSFGVVGDKEVFKKDLNLVLRGRKEFQDPTQKALLGLLQPRKVKAADWSLKEDKKLSEEKLVHLETLLNQGNDPKMSQILRDLTINKIKLKKALDEIESLYGKDSLEMTDAKRLLTFLKEKKITPSASSKLMSVAEGYGIRLPDELSTEIELELEATFASLSGEENELQKMVLGHMGGLLFYMKSHLTDDGKGDLAEEMEVLLNLMGKHGKVLFSDHLDQLAEARHYLNDLKKERNEVKSALIKESDPRKRKELQKRLILLDKAMEIRMKGVINDPAVKPFMDELLGKLGFDEKHLKEDLHMDPKDAKLAEQNMRKLIGGQLLSLVGGFETKQRYIGQLLETTRHDRNLVPEDVREVFDKLLPAVLKHEKVKGNLIETADLVSTLTIGTLTDTEKIEFQGWVSAYMRGEKGELMMLAKWGRDPNKTEQLKSLLILIKKEDQTIPRNERVAKLLSDLKLVSEDQMKEVKKQLEGMENGSIKKSKGMETISTLLAEEKKAVNLVTFAYGKGYVEPTSSKIVASLKSLGLSGEETMWFEGQMETALQNFGDPAKESEAREFLVYHMEGLFVHVMSRVQGPNKTKADVVKKSVPKFLQMIVEARGDEFDPDEFNEAFITKMLDHLGLGDNKELRDNPLEGPQTLERMLLRNRSLSRMMAAYAPYSAVLDWKGKTSDLKGASPDELHELMGLTAKNYLSKSVSNSLKYQMKEIDEKSLDFTSHTTAKKSITDQIVTDVMRGYQEEFGIDPNHTALKAAVRKDVEETVSEQYTKYVKLGEKKIPRRLLKKLPGKKIRFSPEVRKELVQAAGGSLAVETKCASPLIKKFASLIGKDGLGLKDGTQIEMMQEWQGLLDGIAEGKDDQVLKDVFGFVTPYLSSLIQTVGETSPILAQKAVAGDSEKVNPAIWSVLTPVVSSLKTTMMGPGMEITPEVRQKFAKENTETILKLLFPNGHKDLPIDNEEKQIETYEMLQKMGEKQLLSQLEAFRGMDKGGRFLLEKATGEKIEGEVTPEKFQQVLTDHAVKTYEDKMWSVFKPRRIDSLTKLGKVRDFFKAALHFTFVFMIGAPLFYVLVNPLLKWDVRNTSKNFSAGLSKMVEDGKMEEVMIRGLPTMLEALSQSKPSTEEDFNGEVESLAEGLVPMLLTGKGPIAFLARRGMVKRKIGKVASSTAQSSLKPYLPSEDQAIIEKGLEEYKKSLGKAA